MYQTGTVETRRQRSRSRIVNHPSSRIGVRHPLDRIPPCPVHLHIRKGLDPRRARRSRVRLPRTARDRLGLYGKGADLSSEGSHREGAEFREHDPGEVTVLLSHEKRVKGRWKTMVFRMTSLRPAVRVHEDPDGPYAGSKIVLLYRPKGERTSVDVVSCARSSELTPSEVRRDRMKTRANAYPEDLPYFRHFDERHAAVRALRSQASWSGMRRPVNSEAISGSFPPRSLWRGHERIERSKSMRG